MTNASSNSSFNSLALNVWVISPTQLKFDETDGKNVLSGDAFPLVGFPTGQIVFALAGQDNATNPFVAGGVATAASSGSLTNGIEDYNDTVTAAGPTDFTATPTGTSSSGRIQLVTQGFTNVTGSNLQFAAYATSGGVLMLEDDSAGLAVGAAYAQAATALNTSGGYALNLTGLNDLGPVTPVGEVDDIGQFNPGMPDTSSTSATINMVGNIDENDLGVSPPTTGSLNGSYVPDTTNDGRGSIVSMNNNTLLGGFTLQYYVVDSSTVLFIEVDSESLLGNGAAQVAAGVFEAQTTPTSSAARRAMFIVNPVILSRGAAKTSVARQPATKYRLR